MEIKNIVELLASVTSVLGEVKSTYQEIPVNWVLPPNRNKLITLQSKITALQTNCDSLERMINTVLTRFSQLIRTYSGVVSEVRIARALSDKLAELYSFEEINLEKLKTIFINNVQADYARVCGGIGQLPELDTAEKGSIESILSRIRDLIERLKRIEAGEPRRIKEVLDDISTQYSDIESKLNVLLDKILNSLDVSQK